MGEYVIVVCVAVTCIGAATALGAEVKVDGQYAACRVRNLWSDNDTCAEDVSPPDDDAFPLPDRASLPVPEGVWVRGSDHELPVRLTGVSGLSQAELAALLSEQGLTQVTDPDLLRAANAVTAGQTESSEGRSNVESLYTKYGKDNITLVFQGPQNAPPLWKTLLRRTLPLAAADLLLGAVEAEPPDNFFGGPWTVDVDGEPVEVTRTRLEGGTDCLVLEDSSSRRGTACLTEGTESYVSPTTGVVVATVGPMGPVLDHGAIGREVTQLQSEQAGPWWPPSEWPFFKPRKPEPDYVMGVIVDPYRWVQTPDGKWIDQTDGSVHDRPDSDTAPAIERVLSAGRYVIQRGWVARLEDILADMAKTVGRQGQGTGLDPQDPAQRAWLALTALTAEVQGRQSDGRSAADLITASIARIADGRSSLEQQTKSRLRRAARTQTAKDEPWSRNSIAMIEQLKVADWTRIKEDVAALRDVSATVALLADVAAGHTNRAAKLAAAQRAARLALEARAGDREAAVAILLDVAGIQVLHAGPPTEPLRHLAGWWTEPFARRLPEEVADAITAVIGSPGAVDADALEGSLDTQTLKDAVRATNGVRRWKGFAASPAAFVQREEATGDWLQRLLSSNDITAIASHLKTNVLRAKKERPDLAARYDGMLNADGSRNWEAMARRGLRRVGGSVEFHPAAEETRRLALTLAFGPRLEDFVRFVTEELNAETDWTRLPRAGTRPETKSSGAVVEVDDLTTIARQSLRAGPDPYFATALLDTTRILAAYVDKWKLTQAPESFLEDELVAEATFAGTEGNKPRGAINVYREVLVEGVITIAQAYTQLLGQEPAGTEAERELLAERLDSMRGPILNIARHAPFGVVAPRSLTEARSVTYDQEEVVLPEEIAEMFGEQSSAHTATGFGCPVAHPYAAVCDDVLKPTNSLDKLVGIFNGLTREALRRHVRPRTTDAGGEW